MDMDGRGGREELGGVKKRRGNFNHEILYEERIYF